MTMMMMTTTNLTFTQGKNADRTASSSSHIISPTVDKMVYACSSVTKDNCFSSVLQLLAEVCDGARKNCAVKISKHIFQIMWEKLQHWKLSAVECLY